MALNTIHHWTQLISLLMFLFYDNSCYVYGQTCQNECAVPTVYGGGTCDFTPASHCYSSNSAVTIGCSGLLYGTSQLRCRSDGLWFSEEPPTCEESQCPLSEIPEHGSKTDTGNTLYDTVLYTCDNGLYLDGPTVITCTGSGEWNPNTTPICSGNCTISNISHGAFFAADGSALHEGMNIEIICEANFTLTGPSDLTCHDESWSPFVGECMQNCASPVIGNSNFAENQGTTIHGEYVVTRCDDEYTSGAGSNYSTVLTCSDGGWDSTVYCYADCPKPGFPESLSISPDTRDNGLYYHNDVIAISCAEGYEHTHGPAVGHLLCDDGFWMAALIPVCAAI